MDLITFFGAIGVFLAISSGEYLRRENGRQ